MYSHSVDLDGELHQKDLTLEWSIMAHEPSQGPYDPNFGSLHKQSEIWSTIPNTSPNRPEKELSRIVTSSEDQTCRVWNIRYGYNPVLVTELKGHTLAVTSVDWKRMKNGKEYFVSCSDDDFIRVYDTAEDRYDLLFTLNTKFIKDWHTLTYLSLEENGEHLAIVSENGYLFVWNLLEQKSLYSRKIHGGSVESLAWRDDSLICCSSDCCFSTIKFNYEDEVIAKI